MPRRLDPKKGLPGLFQSSQPAGGDMGFLVQKPTEGAPRGGGARAGRAGGRGKASAAKLAAPASTISQISGRHARPAVAQSEPAATPVVSALEPSPVESSRSAIGATPVVARGATAPGVSRSLATSATDVVPGLTSTSSGAFGRAVVVAIQRADFVVPPEARTPGAVGARVVGSGETARLLREAPPVCRVPVLVEPAAALGLEDLVNAAACAVSYLRFLSVQSWVAWSANGM